jgi:hypothetical protein
MIFSENRCPLLRIMLGARNEKIPVFSPSLKAQAEAGPLMPMVRRANIGIP